MILINKISSRIIFKDNSPFFKSEYFTPSDKTCVLLKENTIRINKGSALDTFMNEREDIIKKINELSLKVDELSEDNEGRKNLEEKLEEVDNLISGYESGCLINSTDEKINCTNNKGINLRA